MKMHTGLQEALVRALCEGAGLEALAAILAEYMHGCAAVINPNGTAEFHAYPHQIICPLDAGPENYGTLYVVRTSEAFTADDVQAVHDAAGLFCVKQAYDKKAAGIELRLKGNFVEDLILSHFSDPESILNRARALDYDIKAGHRVLVAVAVDGRKEPALSKTELVQTMQSRLTGMHNGMAVCIKDEIVILVQHKRTANDVSDIKALADTLIEDAAARFKIKLFIGIGSACAGLADFSKSYMEAKKALEIGEYMITEGQVRSFEQFKVHALFLSTLKPADLYNYAREQLGALLNYDEKHGTDFLKTLQEFLYLRNNVEGTAKSLSMSVSGLKYRLQKIEKILSHDLKDYKVCFDLQLALVILQLFGEYQIK